MQDADYILHMKKRQTIKEIVEEAAQAHTDLNVFGAVVQLLEGGLLSSDSQPDDFRIIRICNSAEQKALHRYDAALAKLSAAQE